MRILLTGASGQLGLSVLPALLDRGHEVRCFDLDTDNTRRALKPFASKVALFWGDLRTPQAVHSAAANVEAILHLGAVTPPRSELDPVHAELVNVLGTRNVIAAAQAQVNNARADNTQASPPHLVFTSSVAVYGRPERVGQNAELHADSPCQPCDAYGAHKLACEAEIRASGLPFTLLRIGVSLPRGRPEGDARFLPYLFAHSLSSLLEFVHPDDVAAALCRVLEVPEARMKLLLLGGGLRCQMTLRRLLSGLLETAGLGMLPDSAFAPLPLFGGFLDTRESQALLGYQQRTFEDFLAELRRSLGMKRWGVGLFSPFARRFLLRHSESYQRLPAK